MWVFVLLKPIVILITDGYSINPQETAEAIERLKTCALVRRNKILREEYTIGDELIPELVFALQVDDRSLVFKVYELGHIQEADLLRKIINFFCFSYAHDHVLPYDDDNQMLSISDDSKWEE